MNATEYRNRLSTELTWTPTGHPDVASKHLATGSESTPHEVSILRLAPGGRLPSAPPDWGVEIVVLEGVYNLPEGPLLQHGYARVPPGHALGSTEEGCTLYVRTSPFTPGDQKLVHTQHQGQRWSAGHGNLAVMSLHAEGSAGTAFVFWPAGERFLHHHHWGGEEIFVITGTFRDEYGAYPQGSWIQSGHMSAHHPWVEEDTLILVKTGHLGGDSV